MRNNRAFTLVEVIVAIGLLLGFVLGSMGTNQLVGTGLVQQQNKAQAQDLAREGMEAAQSVRARDFTLLSEGTFHPSYDGQDWGMIGGEEVLGNFTRRIIFSRVQRGIVCGEVVCPIVEAGGVVDEGSLEVVVQVDWVERGENKQVDLDGLVTYWR